MVIKLTKNKNIAMVSVHDGKVDVLGADADMVKEITDTLKPIKIEEGVFTEGSLGSEVKSLTINDGEDYFIRIPSEFRYTLKDKGFEIDYI